MSNLTQCAICGQMYNYCPSCANTHAWKFYTDTHEHYQIFLILKQFKAELINRDEAIKAFKNLGITKDSDLSIFKPRVADKIKNILFTADKPINDKTVLRKTRKSKLYKDE